MTPNPALSIGLDTSHKPTPDWAITKRPGEAKWSLRINGAGDAVYLGYFFEYAGYPEGTTRGLARTSSALPNVRFEPTEWTPQFGLWPELLYPTAWAESNASFTVINAWDRAAITFGFIQLAAHTGDDLLPFFRRLFAEIPDEARQWFPELDVIGGELCFVKGNQFKSLEKAAPAHDGGHTESYYRGDLMAFFNPDRYHAADRAPDPEELQASARWLAWTLQSARMREIQVSASIENLRKSLDFMHRKMLATPAVKHRYPHGVDGMRCDLLAIALAVPHLSEGKIGVVLNALQTANPIESIRNSNYGPGGRAQNTYEGMKKRPILATLIYDLAAQKPVAAAMA